MRLWAYHPGGKTRSSNLALGALRSYAARRADRDCDRACLVDDWAAMAGRVDTRSRMIEMPDRLRDMLVDLSRGSGSITPGPARPGDETRPSALCRPARENAAKRE